MNEPVLEPYIIVGPFVAIPHFSPLYQSLAHLRHFLHSMVPTARVADMFVEMVFHYLLPVIHSQLEKDVLTILSATVLLSIILPDPYLDWNGFIEFCCEHDDDTKFKIKTGKLCSVMRKNGCNR